MPSLCEAVTERMREDYADVFGERKNVAGIGGAFIGIRTNKSSYDIGPKIPHTLHSIAP